MERVNINETTTKKERVLIYKTTKLSERVKRRKTTIQMERVKRHKTTIQVERVNEPKTTIERERVIRLKTTKEKERVTLDKATTKEERAMSAELPTDLLFYVRDDEGETWAYQLVTKPLAALYWKPSSYPLKLNDIKIVTKCTGEVRKQLKRLILRDITECEK